MKQNDKRTWVFTDSDIQNDKRTWVPSISSSEASKYSAVELGSRELKRLVYRSDRNEMVLGKLVYVRFSDPIKLLKFQTVNN